MYTTRRRVAKPSNHENQDQLVQHNLGLVYHVATRMKRTTVGDATLGEMVSAGTLGLMHAAEAFNPSLGTAFSTYAAACIRGAILDDRRRCDTVPRSIHNKARRLREGGNTLTHALGRYPNEEEMAHHMDLDPATLCQWRADVHRMTTISLDQPVADTETCSGALGNLLIDDRSEDAGPMVTLQRAEQVALLRKAILLLKAQQKVVLSLYYYEKLTLAQIGTILKVSESRVSQIRVTALTLLRNACAGTHDTMA